MKLDTPKVTKIKIPVSSIAPLIGMDYYNNFPKIVCEIWRKYNRDQFNKIENSYREKDIDIATDSEARRIVRIDKQSGTNIYQQIKAINAVSGTSECLQAKQNVVINQIKKADSIDQDKKEDLIRQVVSTTNKNHGVNSESNVLAKYELETGLKIQSGQENMIHKIGEDSDLGVEWYLHGKYDGYTTCGRLVEAKKRQKGLFKKLRDYEKVQIQTYLHMKGAHKGSLVESYCTKDESLIHIINVDYDKVFVQDFIIERINSCTDFFKNFVNNEEWKEKILMGDKDREIYKMYQKVYINKLQE